MILFPYPPKSTDSPVNVNPRIGTSVLARRRTDKDNSVLLLFCEDVGGRGHEGGTTEMVREHSHVKYYIQMCL